MVESGAWRPCPCLLWIRSVLYVEHQKGRFLTLVSSHPEAGALNVTTASSGGRPKTKQRSAERNQILYHQHTKNHMELPPGGSASVTLLFVDMWDPAKSTEQVNSCSHVSLRPKIHTLTAGVRQIRLGAQGYVQGCAQQPQEEHRPAACHRARSRVPALLQPHVSHSPVTTGLLALTPCDLPHSTHRSFHNGTKRRKNLPKPEENPFGAKPTEVRANEGWCCKGCLGWADL